ncbi:oxygenase MpaB family protein [Pseudonocardia ailaonensis]|uniref:Oxygenase MpaB family protein n=1 Tax=Pseudonocardia ailaonensis TaxID=367279 RepID=A0ABN2MUM3_9PSEU
MVDLGVPDAVSERVAALRARLGADVFQKVAGDEGPGRRDRIHSAPGPRWFAEDRPIRRVHGDASMFVGGLRALLLQSLHPLAMAGVAGHSGYRGDPWGRLARTSYFLAATTFGPADLADETIDRIKAVHSRVRGTAPDGREYSAGDPHLLEWVHIAEIDSFLRAHQRYGRAPLTPAECDGYVADTARVAHELGVTAPPTTVAELDARLDAFRPELAGTPEARSAAKFLLLDPPLALPARAPYALLAAAAVGLLPRWARRPLQLPYLPLAEATLVKAGGKTITSGIRWIMSAPSPT